MSVLPPRALIGMLHLPPLPGAPAGEWPLARIIDSACEDARRLAAAGFHALMVENFGDAPFRATQVDPHTVACMTVVARAIAGTVDLPLGINVLRNDPLAALAIATSAGAMFIRVNVHVGVYATDQGIIEGRADQTLRYRRRIGAAAAIFADVHVKHARPLSCTDIAEAAEETAYRGRADGLIVSGSGTGRPTSLEDLRRVKAAVPDRPLLVGSGATPETARELLNVADGLIVGTAIKEQGATTAPVDPDRARRLVEAAA
jgi:membrane complex biogenesis BtpA family protein